MSQHASSSEASAVELSKAHAAADAARATAEQAASEANAAASTMQNDLDQCRHILQARDVQVQHLASQCQEANHRLAVSTLPLSPLAISLLHPVNSFSCKRILLAIHRGRDRCYLYHLPW